MKKEQDAVKKYSEDKNVFLEMKKMILEIKNSMEEKKITQKVE